jgi:hypothetical protein
LTPRSAATDLIAASRPRLVQRDRVHLELRRLVLHDHGTSVLLDSRSSLSGVQDPGSRPGPRVLPVAAHGGCQVGLTVRSFAGGRPPGRIASPCRMNFSSIPKDAVGAPPCSGGTPTGWLRWRGVGG